MRRRLRRIAAAPPRPEASAFWDAQLDAARSSPAVAMRMVKTLQWHLQHEGGLPCGLRSVDAWRAASHARTPNSSGAVTAYTELQRSVAQLEHGGGSAEAMGWAAQIDKDVPRTFSQADSACIVTQSPPSVSASASPPPTAAVGKGEEEWEEVLIKVHAFCYIKKI